MSNSKSASLFISSGLCQDRNDLKSDLILESEKNVAFHLKSMWLVDRDCLHTVLWSKSKPWDAPIQVPTLPLTVCTGAYHHSLANSSSHLQGFYNEAVLFSQS